MGVHNGIIENYQELKEKLLKKGYTFYSQTDTEVAIKLVDYYYKKYLGTPVDAINHAMVRIRGSYALELMFKDYPEEIYVARKDSPMIIGVADVECYVASEFRYRNPILDKNGLVIVVSQSGETADTLAALREAKNQGVKTLGIVNVVGSSIAREADSVFYTLAGPEISVATTKAYSAQLIAGYVLSVQFAKVLGRITDEQYADYIAEINTIPEKIEKIIEDKERLQWFASKQINAKDIFFIGRGIDYAISLEGSLKLKEISYIHSEAYAAGELKHGTISLIEDAVEFATYIPKIDNHFTASLAVVPLQLLAYYVSVAKGLDVDKPRNLAKSVTVE